ncbi:hypothetical protein H5P28_01305 [Ruficoccus amylovorans]|uniref:Uncharacterized protein n=1 Tax=Ruficoccus amylovorans TaxID=1804625 RepID=A0A842HAY8_9BACT|nr:hypothetical protein [Ruficoccus amylovorans]MBC2592886.1 hypothetical protein [Ruficoccus amylovorans]
MQQNKLAPNQLCAQERIVSAKPDCHGFALVIALMLMAFIFLLLSSLGSLTIVEVSGSVVHKDLEKARQNALFGMSVALGELQSALGPDQRVNATAALDTQSEEDRKQWLGVYKSWTDQSTTRPAQPEFVRWMVSGDATALKQHNTAREGEIGTPYLGLIRGSTDFQVEAGLVEIEQDDGGGAYAWWIGDENAKARVHTDTRGGNDITQWVERAQGAAGANTQALAYMSGVDSGDNRLGMALPRGSLELFGATSGQEESLMRSLTPYSYGLLTNVRSGGLRKDLSFYLETSMEDRPQDPLYTLDGRNGVHFGELWAYYNLWRQLDFTGALTHPDGGALSSAVPVLTGDADPSVERVSPFGVYGRPLLARVSWMISLQSNPDMDTVVDGRPTEYQMEVVLDPIVTLWNPYDVSLNVPAGSYVRLRLDGLPYIAEVFADGVSINPGGSPFVGSSSLLQGADIELLIGNQAGSELRMRPGEVLMYSIAGSTSYSVSAKANLAIEAQLGWSRGGGIIAPVGANVSEDALMSIELRADPNGRAVAQWELINFEERIGRIGGAISGGFSLDRYGWHGNSMVPSDYPDIFTDIPEITLGTAADLSKSGGGGSAGAIGKFPVAVFSIGLRTEEGSAIPGRFLSRATRAAGGFDLQDLSAETLASQGIDIQMRAMSSITDNPGFDVFNGKAYFGGSYMATSGNSYLITQSIPRTPVYSLAAFQHATAGGLSGLRWDIPTNINTDFHKRKIEPAVAQIVGNSHALPIFAPNQTTGTTNDGHPAIDHSYYANQALWDDWFLSSISPRQSAAYRDAGIDQTQAAVFDAFVGDETPLPNKRMKLHYSGDADDLRTSLFQENGNPRPEAYTLAAESLMVEGMFNVNSTDVDAWTAILSSLRSEPVAVLDLSGSLDWDDEEDYTAIPGLMLPASGRLEDGDLGNAARPEQWLGYRSFTDENIRELAEAIVAQVRLRGPFLSIADFVNRRVGADEDLAKSGALQAALDEVINETLMQGSRKVALGDVPGSLPFRQAEVGARSTGSAAYVDQADLLTILGPGLNVRSDTFTIRSYGEVNDNFGNRVASVRCEAVVQRVPEYVDSAEEPRLAYDQLNNTNKLFGRQFKVVSFRWLDEDEI